MRPLSILGLLLALAWPAQAATTAQKAASGGVPSWVFSPTPTVQLDYLNNRCFVKGAGVTPISVCVSETRTRTGWVQWADGHYTNVPTALLRLSDVGLLAEEGFLNTARNSNDLSQVTWTRTTLTATLDQVGPDFIANSASSLSATAGNSTVVQTPTTVGTTRDFSVSLKCITCTGAIQMTIDGGSTWTTLDATNCFNVFRQGVAPNAGAYERCHLTGVITLGVGVRIVNNADAIAIWDAQVADATTSPSYLSPCPNTASTGTASCGGDNTQLTGRALAAVAGARFPMTVYSSGLIENLAQVTVGVGLGDGTTSNDLRLENSSSTAGNLRVTTGGSTIANISTANTISNGSVLKMSGRAANADYAVVMGGGTPATGAGAGSFPPFTKVAIGFRSDFAGPWNEFLKGSAIWVGQGLSNSVQQALTK